MSFFDNSAISDSEHVSVLFLGARFFVFLFISNNDYTACIKRETQRIFCLYKKSPLLIPLMSRICKLRADVKREYSDLGGNYLAGEVRDLDSRLRGNDNWWGKPHPTNLDSRSFDSFDKTPTFTEASEGRQGKDKA